MPEQRCRCHGGRRPDVTRSASVCVWIMALSYQSYVFSSPRNANASTVTGFLQFRTGGKELTLVGIRYSSGWRAPEKRGFKKRGKPKRAERCYPHSPHHREIDTRFRFLHCPRRGVSTARTQYLSPKSLVTPKCRRRLLVIFGSAGLSPCRVSPQIFRTQIPRS